MQTRQYALLLALLDAMDKQGSWCGETHVQKASYFLQEVAQVPLRFEFILYKHGPYSFELHDFLGDMRARLLVDVKPQPPYGPSLQLGPSASVVTEAVAASVASYKSKIDFIATRLSKHDAVVDLERLATALYVIRNYPGTEDKAEKMNELKPHITKERAAEALDEVGKILREANQA